MHSVSMYPPIQWHTKPFNFSKKFSGLHLSTTSLLPKLLSSIDFLTNSIPLHFSNVHINVIIENATFAAWFFHLVICI